MADAPEWCISSQGVIHIAHYLDDFAVMGPPDSEVCAKSLSTLKAVCGELDVPQACHKEIRPPFLFPLVQVYRNIWAPRII